MKHIAAYPRNGFLVHAVEDNESTRALINRITLGNYVVFVRPICSTRSRPVGRSGMRIKGVNPRGGGDPELFEDLARDKLNELMRSPAVETEVISRWYCERCVAKTKEFI